MFWLPYYMTSHLGYSPANAGSTSAFYKLAGFPGALFAGYVSDRWLATRRFPVMAVMMGALGLVLWIHPWLASRSALANALGLALAGFLTYGPDTLVSGAAPQDAGSGDQTGTAAGFIGGVGSIGQFFSGYVAAYTKDHFGWNALFATLCALSLCGGILLATKWNARIR